MAFPFPGMDPYLESPIHWPDFHPRFIDDWCDAINEKLPTRYRARLGECVYLVEQPPVEKKLIYPDVAVAQEDVRPSPGPVESSSVATLEPVTLPISILEGPRETYIEIVHRPDQTLVTVLELLSPANKEEPGRSQYMEKRHGLLRQPVNLVELDLLRRGRRLPLAAPWPKGDYFYLIARSENRPNCQIYSWTMRQPLPILPVPLRSPDVDILVDLAAVFSKTYQRGRYQMDIDYGEPPPGPMTGDDGAWVIERARSFKGS